MHPVYRAVKKAITEDVLGRVIYVEGDYIHDLRSQNEWQLANELPAIGGGCHPIDIMQWWCGPIDEVQAISSHHSIPQMKADDCVVALLQFANGTVGRCTVAYGLGGPMAELYNLSAYGTRASIIRDKIGLAGFDERHVELPVSYDRGFQYGRHPFEDEVEDTVRAILDGTRPSATVQESASAVNVGLAIYASLRERHAVRVDQVAYS
jgi:predicted dehydrogenase